jgi:hypothetical protein
MASKPTEAGDVDVLAAIGDAFKELVHLGFAEAQIVDVFTRLINEHVDSQVEGILGGLLANQIIKPQFDQALKQFIHDRINS